ncbi:hypothetical protein MVEN_00934700 [Mycena venus]|uniref:Uncharacterized protein n=1 Tax=Mycena venus TaxID=2733690 RepID=A0A8H7CZ82_9AGAR|nr:hypothetical protein MVEN_00934700 [Mycena venus]
MLILFILVHLFSKNGSAVPVAISLDSRSSTDTCDDINNCRKLFDIVWGCLATIFTCTWVSVHPNVPPPNQSWLALFWRRLKMMLIGIIAPEIMVGFAARQFWGARNVVEGDTDSYTEYNFSRTHGYFFCMGGFISSAGYPIATREQLDDSNLGPEFLTVIRSVDAEDIKDKSKGDPLSKGVALAQGVWFTTQCLARVHQHLAVTELEVATLAFAVVNIFIWLLWWDKPLDVQRPIIVGSHESPDAQPVIPDQPPRWTRIADAIFGYDKGDNLPLSSTSVPLFWYPPLDTNLQLGTLVITTLAGSLFGAIHCTAWNTDFPTTTEMWIWRSCSLVIATIPVIILLFDLLGAIISDTIFGGTMLGITITTISFVLIMGSFPIYIFARLSLLSLPLAALRSLPPSAFVDVNWSTYIPHI